MSEKENISKQEPMFEIGDTLFEDWKAEKAGQVDYFLFMDSPAIAGFDGAGRYRIEVYRDGFWEDITESSVFYECAERISLEEFVARRAALQNK